MMPLLLWTGYFFFSQSYQLVFPGQPRNTECGSKTLGLKLLQQVSKEVVMSELYELFKELKNIKIYLKYRRYKKGWGKG